MYLQDNSIRVWYMNKETFEVSCLASAIRHTASVGSIAISQTSCKFFTSVSQDSCLKLWNLPENLKFDGNGNVFKFCYFIYFNDITNI